jgi:hypothetical protein
VGTLVETERLALLLPPTGYCYALPLGFNVDRV